MTTAGAADFDDYLELRADRPQKFAAEQVGYTPATRDSMPCEKCVHFYVNPRRNRRVCEIFRPAGDFSIAFLGSCRFWSPDGELFPKL